MSLEDKINTIAREIYGADGVDFAPAAKRELDRITSMGMGDFPVCMAKTQYSLSDDAKKLGRRSISVSMCGKYMCLRELSSW